MNLNPETKQAKATCPFNLHTHCKHIAVPEKALPGSESQTSITSFEKEGAKNNPTGPVEFLRTGAACEKENLSLLKRKDLSAELELFTVWWMGDTTGENSLNHVS